MTKHPQHNRQDPDASLKRQRPVHTSLVFTAVKSKVQAGSSPGVDRCRERARAQHGKVPEEVTALQKLLHAGDKCSKTAKQTWLIAHENENGSV